MSELAKEMALRVTESHRKGQSGGDHLVQRPCLSRVGYSRLPRAVSSQGLDISEAFQGTPRILHNLAG